MNTFLPYKDYKQCAMALALDRKRFFKQAVEARQIIDIITTGKTKSGRDYPLSMKHHPIVKAWTGYEESLKQYFNSFINLLPMANIKSTLEKYVTFESPQPHWLTDEVCFMYQAHLLRKDHDYYKFNVDVTIPFDWSLIK